MKVKCKYCGIEKRVSPSRIKSKESYYCGSKECRGEHMREQRGKARTKDRTQLNRLVAAAKILNGG